MNPAIGWGLAVIGTALGYVQWGWRGVALAVSATVFWLLLQFSQSLRVMRAAAQAPVGTVDSAVMLQAKLRPGLRLLDLLRLTRSLGAKAEPGEGGDEAFVWRDASGATVLAVLRGGRLVRWQFERPAGDEPVPPVSDGEAASG